MFLFAFLGYTDPELQFLKELSCGITELPFSSQHASSPLLAKRATCILVTYKYFDRTEFPSTQVFNRDVQGLL